MLEFKLMHIDRNIGSKEVFQSSSMVQMQMPHYDHLDIFDVVPCLGDLCVELLFWVVIDLSKDVVEWSAPYFRVVFTRASFEEDQTFLGMLDEYAYDDQLSSFRLRIWV